MEPLPAELLGFVVPEIVPDGEFRIESSVGEEIVFRFDVKTAVSQKIEMLFGKIEPPAARIRTERSLTAVVEPGYGITVFKILQVHHLVVSLDEKTGEPFLQFKQKVDHLPGAGAPVDIIAKENKLIVALKLELFEKVLQGEQTPVDITDCDDPAVFRECMFHLPS
jgi:hypothetical protein